MLSSKDYMLWHDRLGHPGSTMMRTIIANSNGHPLLSKHIGISNDNPYKAYSQGKLVIRPSQLKVNAESPLFLQYLWAYSTIMWTISIFYGFG